MEAKDVPTDSQKHQDVLNWLIDDADWSILNDHNLLRAGDTDPVKLALLIQEVDFTDFIGKVAVANHLFTYHILCDGTDRIKSTSYDDLPINRKIEYAVNLVTLYNSLLNLSQVI